MIETKVFFRVDGNSKIGLGHLNRCVSLGHLLKDTFEISFITMNADENALGFLQELSPKIFQLDYENEIDQIVDLVRTSDILVLDGYQFDLEYQRSLKTKMFKLVYIDDIPNSHMVADVVINYVPGISVEDYSCDPETILCLGLDYLMLRPPFIKNENKEVVSSLPKTSMIALGGADPENITEKVLDVLLGMKMFDKIIIIIGGVNQNRLKLEKRVNEIKGVEVRILNNLNAAQMVKEILDNDLVICSASVTAMEVCTLNKFLVSICYVDNQKKVSDFLKNNNCAIPIENWGDGGVYQLTNQLANLSLPVVQNVVRNQKEIFYEVGSGLIKIFSKLKKEMELSVRRASEKDVDLYFLWANNPDVRDNSVNQKKISLKEHTEWFTRKIEDSNHIFYLFEWGDKPIAQLRFDLKDNAFWINYSIASEFRGQGWSSAVIRLGVQNLDKEMDSKSVIKAIVKYSNLASAKTFVNCSFRRIEDCSINEEKYMVFIK